MLMLGRPGHGLIVRNQHVSGLPSLLFGHVIMAGFTDRVDMMNPLRTLDFPILVRLDCALKFVVAVNLEVFTRVIVHLQPAVRTGRQSEHQEDTKSSPET